MSQYIRPISLKPPIYDDLPGKMATVVGWGSFVRNDSPNSHALREVTLPTVDVRKCEKLYRNNFVFDIAFPGGFLGRKKLCVGSVGGKGACTGDSGGPLMVRGSRSKWLLVGVVSVAADCGSPDYPTVYTRVSAYLPWIERTIRRLATRRRRRSSSRQ